MGFDPVRTPVATLRLWPRVALLAHQAAPADRARCADAKMRRRLAARHAAVDRGKNAAPEIHRQRLRHALPASCSGRHRESDRRRFGNHSRFSQVGRRSRERNRRKLAGRHLTADGRGTGRSGHWRRGNAQPLATQFGQAVPCWPILEADIQSYRAPKASHPTSPLWKNSTRHTLHISAVGNAVRQARAVSPILKHQTPVSERNHAAEGTWLSSAIASFSPRRSFPTSSNDTGDPPRVASAISKMLPLRSLSRI